MAEIRSFLLWRHLRAEPTNWVAYFKNGRRRRSERGLAFWFAPLGASIVEVPLDDRELPFLLAGRSADFQDVHVNGVVTFRVREAWASVTTGAALVDGALAAGATITVTSEMNDGGTVFGDGIEADHLDLPFGQTVALGRAAQSMRLVA